MKPPQLNHNTISIVGLGKLGLPLAACFASRGFKTIGIDVSKNVVDATLKGIPPIIEPGLTELVAQFQANLTATQNHEEAIEKSDITFIIVATPSDPRGNFSNSYVESALKSLAQTLKKSHKQYHLFVISSTVMPGSTEQVLIPLIEQYSQRKLNKGFGVCYVPDFIALGTAIHDFLNPDLVLVGESDAYAGEQIAAIYKRFCENEPRVARMPIMSAEIAKVTLNTYVTTKISFANALANLCEKIPGADVDAITWAIGIDKRVSPHYFKGGLSFGGTCFPRDTKAFIAFAEKYGEQAELIKTVEKINDYQDQHLLKTVLEHLPLRGEKKVAVLGLAFKPNTPIIIGSPSIKLIKELLKKKVRVIVYDPLAMANTKELLGKKISYADSAKECVSSANVGVVTLSTKEFKEIDETDFKKDSATIIDCWRILDASRFGKKVKYLAVGKYASGSLPKQNKK